MFCKSSETTAAATALFASWASWSGPGMPHTFAMDYAIYPEAENAMDEILTLINNVPDLN